MDSEIVGSIDKHSESGISSMAGTSNRNDVPAGFTLAVDNAMNNYGASPVHDFASAVDNAMTSYGASHSPVHGFASSVDNAISSYGVDLGASHSPVHGFGLSVDSAIRSYGGGDLGTSQYSHVHGLQLFTLAQLVAATNNFSLHNMIGAGGIGVMFRGKLVDGSEVAIRRVEAGSKMKEFQQIAFLPRVQVQDNHLVGLVGFCARKDKKAIRV